MCFILGHSHNRIALWNGKKDRSRNRTILDNGAWCDSTKPGRCVSTACFLFTFIHSKFWHFWIICHENGHCWCQYSHWPALESYRFVDSREDMGLVAYADAAHSFHRLASLYYHRTVSSLSIQCDKHLWYNVLSMLPYHHGIQQQKDDIVSVLHCISLMTKFLGKQNKEKWQKFINPFTWHDDKYVKHLLGSSFSSMGKSTVLSIFVQTSPL